MDTEVVMEVVGSRLDDLEALSANLEGKFGIKPSLNLRLEIGLGEENVVVSVDDEEIIVRDEKLDKTIASGDRNLARLALKGMEASRPAPPTP
jgi:hypothetical protein